jgi:hypothetical protein
VTLSRLTEPVRFDITLAFVVLGTSAARGLTVAQLGDLGAVAGLSMINLAGVRHLRARSILQLVGADSQIRKGISEATQFDVAYLRALYAGGAGYSAQQQAVRLGISIAHDRAKQTAPPP